MGAGGTATAVPHRCPECGGTLGAPVSGAVHCYVDCTACGERFELDDPRFAARSP